MHTEFVFEGTRQMTVSFGRNDNARTQLTLSTDAHSLQIHSGPFSHLPLPLSGLQNTLTCLLYIDVTSDE